MAGFLVEEIGADGQGTEVTTTEEGGAGKQRTEGAMAKEIGADGRGALAARRVA